MRIQDLEILPLFHPRSLKVFDGTDPAHGKITHIAKTTIDIGGHVECIFLFVTTLASFDVVLGLPWLQFHNPQIYWSQELPTFDQKIVKILKKSFQLRFMQLRKVILINTGINLPNLGTQKG